MTLGPVAGNAHLAPPLEGMALERVCARVEAYYAAKLARHGATAPGVDWSCTATQWLRFAQLLKVCQPGVPFSLIDLGCGYGALAAFLVEPGPGHRPGACSDYLGIDLSPAMVRRARRRHRANPSIRFAVGRTASRSADYAVASGIMNVMLGHPLTLWEGFVRTMLLDLDRLGRLGFAVNFLTEPSPDAPTGQLYCPDPAVWVDFCRHALGRSVELVRNYGLAEVTLLARARDAA
jgi:SAM-dependent methyltransferase